MKLITDYPKVRVIDSPGFSDHDGWLLMDVQSADGRPLSVVGYSWDGKHEFDLHPSQYVHLVSD